MNTADFLARPWRRGTLLACCLPSVFLTIAWVVIVTIATVPMQGQSAASARISGTVQSESGAPVASAQIKIEGPGLVRQENSQLLKKANLRGRYEAEVPAGGYDVWVSAPDFEEVKLRVELAPGAAVERDVKLRPIAKPYAYRVEQVELPRTMIPELSGVAFTPRGSLVVVNRRGEVWIRAADSGRWRRFAFGLYEPFGVVAESESDIWIIQRPEITRLHDTNGDGQADHYETLVDTWGITGNYHEFSYGLARDRAGNLYGGFGMASVGEFPWVRGPVKRELTVPSVDGAKPRDPHSSVAQYQGWAFRAGRDGSFTPLATGLRQPLGIGVSPADEFFVTDVSGSWVPTSVLLHIEAGSFYGHPDGLKWDPEYAGRTVTPEQLAKMRRPPTVYLPRGLMGTSPGQPIWDTTGGKFGPFSGQIFIGDVSSVLLRVDLEKVEGVYQGAGFPFLRAQGLHIGGMHHAFGPDGALYIAQTTRGWMPTEGTEGLQRVVWTGENPVDLLQIRLARRGFALRFTEPMTAAAGEPRNYRVRRFQYNYHIHDGSLRVNQVNVPVVSCRLSEDRRAVDLELLEMQPDYIYEFELTPEVASEKGRPLLNPVAYYTANRLLPGTEVRPTTLVAQSAQALEPPDPARGEPVFRLNCMVCHQADGKGSKQVGTPDYTAPTGPLARPDAELLAVIANGKQAMPAFGNVLPPQAIHDVLAYLRKTFAPAGRAPTP